MGLLNRRPALRWLVPVLAVAVAIGGGATASAIAASQPKLPPRSAAELLVALQTAEVPGLSGTVVHTADLGLPALPDSRGHGSADLGSLWSGSSTLRVWYAGPRQVRVALLGTLGQSDIIRDGRDFWIWDSTENRASHWELPAVDAPPHRPATPAMTPQEAADAALAAIDPTTEVSTGNNARVAGRDAYELVLTPRDDASLIREIRLAVDAEHSIPLGVSVFGAATDPAYEVRFTSIDFETPDPEQFRFNPPPGSTVIEGPPLTDLLLGPLPGISRPEMTVIGEGWTSVLVIRVPDVVDRSMVPLDRLPTIRGDWGSGQVMMSNLLSALITEDGRLLVGAVTVERLAQVAGDPAATPRGE